jgi:hypothetical protein
MPASIFQMLAKRSAVIPLAMFHCSHRERAIPIDTSVRTLITLNRLVFTAFPQYAGTVRESFWGWTMGTIGNVAMPTARLKTAEVKLLLQMTLWTGLLLAGPARLLAQSTLSQSELYCAGFFTRRPIETGLIILGSEDGGFKNEFATGDYVYLSKGSDAITGLGGQYSVLRPEKDVNRKQAFPGQRMILQEMGTLYAEVGRVEVSVLHERSATAKILMACDSIHPGDIAVPFNARPTPAFKTPHMTPRFASLSGKATGIIAASEEYNDWMGEGSIVYLNLGSAQGLQPGAYLYVTRGYMKGGNADFAEAADQYPTEFGGTPIGLKLTPEQKSTLPQEVLGEAMVLSVEDGSATAILTYSRSEVGVGDAVALE